ncbi:LuxR C-terminal-related transcriptional regulator [Chryseobacterium sp. FH1]|uniref:LuxR C-terminal-related transcriptional regulator n=1 Tax=Chryseobacterium sp. FH1 TaxID=1233951 RepID=UPI0004E2A227|nr:LuxR C-terminal-related transcriptional regulator [Chryseobacterium sp. FH1]KFC19339.1 hypothetical protein IO90_08500 [Chryseobacterium sp. FH1]
MTKTRIYPGMLDKSLEYFQVHDVVYFLQNGVVKKFTEREHHSELQEVIDNDRKLKTVLTQLCGPEPTQQQMLLAKCRFGGLDFEPDFKEGKSSHDYRECSKRGNCIGENIVCRPPLINGKEVSQQELKILRYCSGNTKNEAIASEMNIPYGTLTVMKTKIYKKYNFQTKQQSATTLMAKGLL